MRSQFLAYPLQWITHETVAGTVDRSELQSMSDKKKCNLK